MMLYVDKQPDWEDPITDVVKANADISTLKPRPQWQQLAQQVIDHLDDIKAWRQQEGI